MNGFRKCPKGHYYKEELGSCPYCNSSSGGGTVDHTIIVDGGGFGNYAPGANQGPTSGTIPMGGAVPPNQGSGGAWSYGEPPTDPTTIAMGGGASTMAMGGNAPTINTSMMGGGRGADTGHTMFGDEVIETMNNGDQRRVMQERRTRRLVGWLVTYTFDPMGADFRLYEGRNIIGRSLDCNITVNDPFASGKHATILFKNGKFKVRDEMSTHGTTVNGNDIDDDPVELQDGDMIKIGNTVFLFRRSL